MPVVIVEMWAGRTIQQKKELARGITAAFTKINTPADQVHIILKDNPLENWAIAGKLVSEEAPQVEEFDEEEIE